MCFSNLPIEFDETGDPYLAEEAEAVSEPGTGDPEAATPGSERVGNVDTIQDVDPEDAFEEILESVTKTTRMHLSETSNSDDVDAVANRDSAEGD